MGSLRSIAGKAVSAGMRLLPLAALQRRSEYPLLAPVYHAIAEAVPPHVRYLFPLRHPRTFSDDLDFFQRHYTPVTLAQLHRHAAGEQALPDRAVFLSFDDGMREVADVVAPMLTRRGIPATFFLNSAFVDNRSLFYRHKASLLCDHIDQLSDSQLASLAAAPIRLQAKCADRLQLKQSILSIGYAERAQLDELAAVLEVDFPHFLSEKQPYLTSEQITVLLGQGFTIGAHSIDHPRYATIALDEQLRHTRDSTLFLMERFGITTRDLAFPFVSDGVSSEFFKEAYQNKLVEMLFCLNGVATRDVRNIERFWMESNATAPASQIIRHFCVNRWRSRWHNARGGSAEKQ
jgi:peptidoglycan/xylan/chitin deacetylase (PgdA/CDA1 family)